MAYKVLRSVNSAFVKTRSQLFIESLKNVLRIKHVKSVINNPTLSMG